MLAENLDSPKQHAFFFLNRKMDDLNQQLGYFNRRDATLNLTSVQKIPMDFFVLLVLSRKWMGIGEWDDYY